MKNNWLQRLEDPHAKLIPAVIYAVTAIYLLVLIAFITLYAALMLKFWPYHTSAISIFLGLIIFLYAFCVAVGSIFIIRDKFVEILLFPFAPMLPALSLFYDRQDRAYLKRNGIQQNFHASIVVIVTYPDRTHWSGWFKLNVTKDETVSVVNYLKAKKSDFAFYLHASPEDVRSIMADPNVREVCFFGHGDSHIFRLTSKEDLYYCDFNDKQYAKDFVHQIHCGDSQGRTHRLIDYVVPPENRATCFWFGKIITGMKIKKEFKQRIQRLARGEKEI